MIYVIGSGPSGVGCASALLDLGLDVTMVDPGIDLEPERRVVVDRMAAARPEAWRRADLASIRASAPGGAGGIPDKAIYGSRFPYLEADPRSGFERRGVGAGPSHARGGYSNVWGAVVAPYPDADLDGWPGATRRLEAHYAAVLRLMPFSAEADDLASSLLPLYADHGTPLRGSRQGEAFLADAEKHREALRRAGILVGRSRLAVRAGAGDGSPGCVYCGLCLHGCPYGLIYRAQSTIERLRRSPRFRYRPGLVVRRLEETAEGVTVHAHDPVADAPTLLAAERVYLACGVYSTTRILLESLDIRDRPVVIRDSQYFLLPLLRFRRVPDVRDEALHTLAQAFVEIRDAAISPHTVHLEIFTYNDMMPAAAAVRLGRLAPWLGLPVDAFLRRVIVAQGFLHSDASPTIEARLERPGRDGVSRLVVEGRANPETRPTISRIWRKLLAQSHRLRAVPVPPLIEVAEPGRGYHSGGSFPMRDRPGELESDIWGRPGGLKRVHAVDASVLPTLPATTVTLPVMANAHRIGSAYGETR